MNTITAQDLANQAKQLYDLLKSKRRWLRASLAESRGGFPVAVNSPEACRYCLVGGIAAVTGCGLGVYNHVRIHPLGRIIASVIQGMEGCSIEQPSVFPDRVIYHFNDDHTHEEVMTVVSLARAHCEGMAAAGMEV